MIDLTFEPKAIFYGFNGTIINASIRGIGLTIIGYICGFTTYAKVLENYNDEKLNSHF